MNTLDTLGIRPLWHWLREWRRKRRRMQQTAWIEVDRECYSRGVKNL